jgi:hypothetical protein
MKKTIAIIAAFAFITGSLLVGCKSSPERNAHTATKLTLDSVYAASDAWLDSFIFRAAEYRVTNNGVVSLDLSRNLQLSHEWQVVNDAYSKFQSGAKAAINATILVKTLASTNGLSPQQIALLNNSLSAAATNLMFLINKPIKQ